MPVSHALLLFAAYLLGSIPFGFLLTRLCGLGDIRGIGSGNIGATNVLRTGKKGLAALTLLLDGLKGAVAVWGVALFAPEMASMAGLAALMGHMFPLWLDFKGGKGVATFIGVLLALVWPAGVAFILMWLVIALWLRISSLSALIATATAPIFVFIFEAYQILPVVLLMVLLIVAKHRGNIARLLRGAEPRIGETPKNHREDDQKAA